MLNALILLENVFFYLFQKSKLNAFSGLVLYIIMEKKFVSDFDDFVTHCALN